MQAAQHLGSRAGNPVARGDLAAQPPRTSPARRRGANRAGPAAPPAMRPRRLAREPQVGVAAQARDLAGRLAAEPPGPVLRPGQDLRSPARRRQALLPDQLDAEVEAAGQARREGPLERIALGRHRPPRHRPAARPRSRSPAPRAVALDQRRRRPVRDRNDGQDLGPRAISASAWSSQVSIPCRVERRPPSAGRPLARTRAAGAPSRLTRVSLAWVLPTSRTRTAAATRASFEALSELSAF